MSLRLQRSQQLFREAKTLMPGGVNSPVRAFGSVGGDPLFMVRGKGAYMWDADGNRFTDYINSWGPAILGHAHPEVVKATQAAIEDGFTFGTPTEKETLLAKEVTKIMPHIDMLRFVSSGTEACMSALRLARGFTGRSRILKFQGCYHGHADFLLVKAGSGMATLGIPGSPGVPAAATNDTLTAPFNDVDALSQIFAKNATDLAAVILEPIVGNAGFIRPTTEFVKTLRELCTRYGTVLIYDEVMTGFRVALGGAQSLHGIKPDLTTLGKVIGGGMPIGAYGGRRDIMERVAPSGDIYQAGTLSGNPVAMTCGLKTLEVLQKQDFRVLAKRTKRMMDGLASVCRDLKIPVVTDCEGGMFGFNFCAQPVRNFDDASKADMNLFKRYFWGMLEAGIYLAPSAYEAGFVSFAHSDQDIEAFIKASDSVLRQVKA